MRPSISIPTASLTGVFCSARLQRPEEDADHNFSEASDWPELVAAHAGFVEDYNHQPYWAHRNRPDGRRAPPEAGAS
jgi:hypothetical protein